MQLNLKQKIALWISVWIPTRALMIVMIGYWLPSGSFYQDVDIYSGWSQSMANGAGLPNEPLWQYPPGAAFVMLLPRLSPEAFQPTFMVMMLAVDLIGFWLITRFAKEEGRDVGVWIWLLGLPLLATVPSWGGMPLLRFDLVPTIAAMAGLLLIHRRPTWFGAFAAAGAMVKVWPAFLLFGEWDRRRLLRAGSAALAVILLTMGVTALFLGNPLAFLDDQGGRGLQLESVGTLPWKLREVVTAKGQFLEARYGSTEIATPRADAVAKALDVAAVLVLLVAAVWWRLRERGIRNGRKELEDVALSRDFVFTVVLMFVVVSRVLSPQYMIWLLGLSAIVLTSRHTRIARAAWITVGAIVLSAAVVTPVAITLVIRNLVLLYAAIDAAAVLSLILLRSREGEPKEAEPRADGLPRPAADSVVEVGAAGP